MFKQELEKAQQVLLECDILGPTVKNVGPCTLKVNSYKPFAELVSSIASQQLSVKAADTIVKRVKRLIGDDLLVENVLAVTHQQLRECGLSNRKAEYIQLLASNIESGTLTLGNLDALSNQQIIDLLMTQKGIGQWTAEMFLIFSLGRLDVFSELDLGLQKAMRKVFSTPDLKVSEMKDLSIRWSPYRSIACWYLWRSL